MAKETLTLSDITHDLKIIAHSTLSNAEDWRLAYILPATMFAISVIALLKAVWPGLLIFTVAAYHIVRYVMELKKYSESKKAIDSVLDRGDISISVEHLSHIAEETIYEPHRHGRHSHATKQITQFYFNSGVSWRVPNIFQRHYEWSREFHLSTQGLKNVSVSGNDFFYVSLQGYPHIVYVYPCKLFELDSQLKTNITL